MNFKSTAYGQISALSQEDFTCVKNLDQEYFPTPWSESAWLTAKESPETHFMVILSSELETVGFSLFTESIADSFAHLLKIVIHPNHRKSGLGKVLLSQSLEILRERGIRSFFLEVEENNHAAIKIYTSLGFKMIHKKKHFYSNGQSALIMTLEVL